jgi:hypothetical protein
MAFSYFLPGAAVSLTQGVFDNPCAAPLRTLGDVTGYGTLANSERGVEVTLAGAPRPEQSLPWTAIPGQTMLFRCDSVKPTWKDVARASIPPAVDVRLKCGHTVSVALALESPRKMRFSGGPKADAWASELPELANKIYSLKDGDGLSIELMGAFMLAALQPCYRITAEILDAMDILTTDDFYTIYFASLGQDPKASTPGQPT